MLLMDTTVKDFIVELASSSPAPGGGSIAAVSGASGAGLGEMICALTIQKTSDLQLQQELLEIQRELEKSRQRLIELVDEDTEAFNRVMAAFRLPKSLPEEKELRSKRIAEANLYATRIPLETGTISVRVMDLLLRAVDLVSDNVLSDCGVGIECSATAARGAFMNVAINLPGVKDESEKNVIQGSLETLKAGLEKSYEEAKQHLTARFKW